MDLGIVDSIWDVSLHRERHSLVLVASSLPAAKMGWYKARIGFEGRIWEEQRMLPEGNYDKHPDTNRPPIRAIIEAIPDEDAEAVAAVRLAYDILSIEEE